MSHRISDFRGGRGSRGRGSWRTHGPRGDGHGTATTCSDNDNKYQTTLPPRPLGPAIDSIDIKTLLIEEDDPKIDNVSYVASYNWLDGEEPVILVPGSPPAWTPPAQDEKLKPDSNEVFRDINAAKYASFPMEPALRSLLALEPEFDLQSIDVIGCGSTMGSLLRFASAQPRPFRFDVDRAGDTVILVRRESSPKECIKDLKGYGHSFPEKYTTWDSDVGQSCSHQRVVQYDFGGLRILLRSETDGYLKQVGAEVPPTSTTTENKSTLPEIFGAISMGNVVPSQSESQKLHIKMQGTKVPQNRIFDIKTRWKLNKFDMGEILPRLWMNQTPNFLLAYNENGTFENPKVKDIQHDINTWQKNNAALLGIFHGLVKRIVDTVRDSDNPQLEVSWDGQGPLRITRQIGEGRRALPSDMHTHWENV